MFYSVSLGPERFQIFAFSNSNGGAAWSNVRFAIIETLIFFSFHSLYTNKNRYTQMIFPIHFNYSENYTGNISTTWMDCLVLTSVFNDP